MEAAPARADAKALGRAVRSANRAVIEAAVEGRGRSGMGTTLTAALIEGTRIAIAHVGDSRAYLLHQGSLERITEDHSMVADLIRSGQLTAEEARSHPNRSVVTRALGSDPNMLADTFEVDASPGDRLLLCSDGLTGTLEDRQIEDILESTSDPESTVRMLIDAANAAGGHDNISVIVTDVPKDAEESTSKVRSGRPWLSALIWVFALIAIVTAAAWGVNRYAHSQAYLISEEGNVVLYRGLPGSIAGFQLNWIEEETSITVRLLEPVTAARLAQGITVANVTEGRLILAGYRESIESTATADPSDSTTQTSAP